MMEGGRVPLSALACAVALVTSVTNGWSILQPEGHGVVLLKDGELSLKHQKHKHRKKKSINQSKKRQKKTSL